MAREVAAPQPPTAKAIAPRIAGALKHEVNVRIGVERAHISWIALEPKRSYRL
jgi:hypothetical protein